MIGFGVLGFAIDLDGSDGRFLYSTNLVNLESNKKKLGGDLKSVSILNITQEPRRQEKNRW
jgi:hypothetical protein